MKGYSTYIHNIEKAANILHSSTYNNDPTKSTSFLPSILSRQWSTVRYSGIDCCDKSLYLNEEITWFMQYSKAVRTGTSRLSSPSPLNLIMRLHHVDYTVQAVWSMRNHTVPLYSTWHDSRYVQCQWDIFKYACSVYCFHFLFKRPPSVSSCSVIAIEKCREVRKKGRRGI